jgi:glycosyltransferase involved in cell wall biosynthesis
MKLIIIHPGIQHSPRLANGASRSDLFESVTLLTSILFKPKQQVISLLKKRIKPIDEEVQIANHYFYTLLYSATKYLYNKLFVNPANQSHNNPIYFWQQVFGYLCLPRIYFNRKNLLVVCFETTGWPIVKYCKKWNVPVVMDFASISHEKARTLGINETPYGINLKLKERALIDYGFYCSEFCRKSFEGLTSAKENFVLYLGAEASTPLSLTQEIQDLRHKTQYLNIGIKENNIIKISFIANLEYRKGLDIFLESVYAFEYPASLEVHLIGRIRAEWVKQHLPKEIINQDIKLIYHPAMSQSELFAYLQKEAFAMVVPETMMHGIPNVVSPFVGAGEMLKDGIDGFMMKELNSQSLQYIFNDYIALSTQKRKDLKKQVLDSSKKMVWENYYANLGLALKEILADLK